MDQDRHDETSDEQRREVVRVATGILTERYRVAPETGESALMDWSRITGIGVEALAARVVDDVQPRARLDDDERRARQPARPCHERPGSDLRSFRATVVLGRSDGLLADICPRSAVDEHEQDAVVVEVRRELINLAAGILIERYGVPSATAESALMDWSRISELGVHDLAARVVADAQRAAQASGG